MKIYKACEGKTKKCMSDLMTKMGDYRTFMHKGVAKVNRLLFTGGTNSAARCEAVKPDITWPFYTHPTSHPPPHIPHLPTDILLKICQQ